jgi:hypothetical protein
MRPAPAKLFALTLALGGVVTVLTGRREPEPDAAGPPDPPWAETPGGPSSPVVEFVRARGLLAREVAAGRRSLREAAGLVRDLRRRYPGLPRPSLEARDWSQHLPAITNEERLCLEVILCVRVVDGDPPDAARVEAVTTRLEGEFRTARYEARGHRAARRAAGRDRSALGAGPGGGAGGTLRRRRPEMAATPQR